MGEAKASDALDLALVVFANPGLVPAQRAAPIPAGIGDLLRVAAGQQESIERHCDRLGETPERLAEAARFFVEQLMLSREAAIDPWRVLGVERGVPEEVVRENRHWLLRLVHPDRSSDWADAYADRVQRAWREVRAGAQEPASSESGAVKSGEDDWDLSHHGLQPPVQPQALIGLDMEHARAGPRWGRWSFGGMTLMFLAALVWGPQLEDALRGDELPVFGGVADAVDATESQPAPTAQDVQSGTEAPPPFQDDASSAVLVDADRQSETLRASPAAVSATTGLTRSSSVPRDASVTTRPEDGRRAPPADSSGAARTASHQRSAPPGDAGVEPVMMASAPPEPGPRVSDESARRLTGVAPTDPGAGAAVPSPIRTAPATPAGGTPAPNASSPGAVVVASSSATPAPTTNSDVSPTPSAPSAVSATPRVGQEESSSRQVNARSDEPGALTERPAMVAGAVVATTAPANQSAVQTSRPAWPTIDEAKRTVDAFQQHYSRGDLVNLVSLFAAGANPRRGGLAGLHADYAKLFGDTETREIEFSSVRWQPSGNVLVGNGRFEVKLARKGRLFKQRVSGAVRVEVVSTEHGPRLFNLVPVEGS